MKIRPNWRELLAKLVEGQEWAPICRRAKLNPTYLRDVIERHQTPQLKSAEKLSDALGVELTDWYILPVGGNPSVDGGNKREQDTPVPRFDIMPRDIPVFGAGQAGEDGSFELNSGEAIDFVKRPPRLSAVTHAYAIYVQGTSMSPWRKEGELVYVHEKQPPQIGDHVVIQIKPRKAGEAPRAYIKTLEKRTSTEIVVSQYNPPKRLTFALNKLVSLHRVVEWSELLGV